MSTNAVASRRTTSPVGWLAHRLLAIVAAAGLTLALFLVLPLMQTINKPPEPDLVYQSVDTANLDPPPPPPQEQPEERDEPDEPPPELQEEAPPLSLAQLEVSLNPGFSEGWVTGDFDVKLQTVVSAGKDDGGLFNLADLDQKPRAVYQPGPPMTAKLRKRTPGTVYVIFVVDKDGRVQNPIVQRSSDPMFEKPALAAVKRWRFEPGKRNGEPVRFRMRVPMTFPEAK